MLKGISLLTCLILILLLISFGTISAMADNKAVSLDGHGAYVNIGKPVPESAMVQDAITLEAWIKPNELPWTQIGGMMLDAIIACQWDRTYTGYSLQLDGRIGAHGGIRDLL